MSASFIIIELPKPTDRVYLSEDNVRHMLKHPEESPFIYKDAKSNEVMTVTLLRPQPNPPSYLNP